MPLFLSVADPGSGGDVLDGLVDARVDAQGQAVAGGVDGLDYQVQFAGLPADHVQRRAEVLAVQLRQRLELPGARREERAVGGVLAHRGLRDQPGFALHAFRSEEHTSELQSLMRTSYAVF